MCLEVWRFADCQTIFVLTWIFKLVFSKSARYRSGRLISPVVATVFPKLCVAVICRSISSMGVHNGNQWLLRLRTKIP